MYLFLLMIMNMVLRKNFQFGKIAVNLQKKHKTQYHEYIGNNFFINPINMNLIKRNISYCLNTKTECTDILS